MTSAVEPHDWLSIDDGEGTTWLFDTHFLLSNYHCIYGAGCRSIEPEPDPTGTIGCCAHGAHFVDRDDRRRVLRAASKLSDDEWQFRARAMERGGPLKKKGGEWMTRKAEGSCIFLNRSGFAGGSGCALHLGAVAREERPIDWKPTVCWQVPIRLDVHENEHGHETVMVRAWERRDWGPGGDEFNWWCIEDEAAYTAATPVYLNASEELIELIGEGLYGRLVTAIEARSTVTPVSISST